MKKSSGTASELDAALLEMGPEFKGCHCLLHSEVLLLLRDVQERRREEALTLPLPPPSKAFLDSLDYVGTFGGGASFDSNRELIKSLRRSMSGTKLREFEMAQLANLAPATVEEAIQLIPRYIPLCHGVDLVFSLNGLMWEDELQRILDEISNTKKYM